MNISTNTKIIAIAERGTTPENEAKQRQHLYKCDGFRSVRADSFYDAARIFAGRKATREFGKNGYCRTLRRDCWTEDGCSEEYRAFVGYEDVPNTTDGFDICLAITRSNRPA